MPRSCEECDEPVTARARMCSNKCRNRKWRRTAKSFETYRRYRERHPEREKARKAVNNAVRSGRLIKPSHCGCGSLSVEAHHHLGYEPEHWFDIEWLCKQCHWDRHA